MHLLIPQTAIQTRVKIKKQKNTKKIVGLDEVIGKKYCECFRWNFVTNLNGEVVVGILNGKQTMSFK